ncbi:L2 [Gull papillomavirus 1]|uniref:L2 n=1 Tax=Gull papillomavirus 1 TaxID=2562547 RepID=A0AAE5YMV0_9PAPI|nr:L2 [Gull papillomavirus 1]
MYKFRAPLRGPVYLRRPLRYGLHRLHGPSQPTGGAGGRRRRAAAEDLWRGTCQHGDCPDDVKQKFTQNTIADKILKWLGGVLYLGGLSIGTGAGAGSAETGAAAAGAATTGGGGGVPWPNLYSGPGRPGSFIPVERPFVLPGSEVPVHVETLTPETVMPSQPDTAVNTFVNPAYDGDLVSIAASDNVVISDVVPAPPSEPVPEAPAVLEFPDEGPRTRGDTFVTEDMLVAELPRRPDPFTPHRLSEPDMGSPFVQIELATLPGRGPPAIDPFVVGEVSTSFGGDADWALYESDMPTASTPLPGRGGPRASVTFANPAYEPHFVDEIYARDLAAETAAAFGHAEAAEALGTPVVSGRGGRVWVSRLLRRAGMTLRSGRNVPYTVRLLGDISPITNPAEPDALQLRSMTPVGSGDAFMGDLGIAEHSLSHATTLPWDGRPIDITDVVHGPEAPFEDIPLYEADLFPEMEIIEDEGPGDPPGGVSIAGSIRASAPGSVWASGNYSGRQPSSGGVRVYGPAVDVLPAPDVPGVLVSYFGYGGLWDPSLYWLFLRKRRRLHRLFYR